MAQDDDSTRLQGCIDRMRSGDPTARDELMAHTSERLTRLTREMLRDFPGVQHWEQTDDVFQNAALRLWRALSEVQPPTVTDFLRLAAAQVRRELLDLARRYSGGRGLALYRARFAGASETCTSEPAAGAEPADTTNDPDRLAAWTDFHREVEALPATEREAFDLLFYQGLSQAEAAAALDVSQRTIKRRWQAARLRLAETLGATMPSL